MAFTSPFKSLYQYGPYPILILPTTGSRRLDPVYCDPKVDISRESCSWIFTRQVLMGFIESLLDLSWRYFKGDVQIPVESSVTLNAVVNYFI